jgi:hypothetical protein
MRKVTQSIKCMSVINAPKLLVGTNLSNSHFFLESNSMIICTSMINQYFVTVIFNDKEITRFLFTCKILLSPSKCVFWVADTALKMYFVVDNMLKIAN